ncbi:MAG: universal stress protein [Solirubrobacteraceae bacterium]
MTETRTPQPKQDPAAEASDGLFADILCAVDGTRRSFAAVEQAAILAGPQGSLTLLAVTAVAGSGVNRHAAIGPQRAQRILERAEGIARAAGVPCSGVIEPEGPPSQLVLKRAAGHDLLALGAPASSWLGGRFIDGVADAALGSFTVPLLTAHAMPRGEHRFLEHVLVASDGLDGSDQMVELVARLAREHDSKVTLLHAMKSKERPQSIQEQASRLLEEIDGACAVRVEVGGAAELIVAVAKQEGSSLVVMNSRRLGGWKAIGSVSRRVVHDAHCSVLLTQPTG